MTFCKKRESCQKFPNFLKKKCTKLGKGKEAIEAEKIIKAKQTRFEGYEEWEEESKLCNKKRLS